MKKELFLKQRIQRSMPIAHYEWTPVKILCKGTHVNCNRTGTLNFFKIIKNQGCTVLTIFYSLIVSKSKFFNNAEGRKKRARITNTAGEEEEWSMKFFK